MKRLALAALLIAQPAFALDVDLAALLANPDSVPEAALAACDLGVTDPTAADSALTAAGWQKSEGEGEGTWAYTMGDTYIMMWADPGFCMVDDASLTTAEMWDALHALGLHVLPVSQDADGCDTADMGGGVTATLNGPGNDPACTSNDGSAMRFQMN